MTKRGREIAGSPRLGTAVESRVRFAGPFPWRRTVGWTLALWTISPPAVLAQDRPLGSRNLPVDHWAYEYITRLRSRGYLPNLNPTVQPHRRSAVVLGLRTLDPDTLVAPVDRWVRMLRAEFQRELDRLEGRGIADWGFRGTGGFTASSSQRLDPVRPVGEEDAWPWVQYGAWAETGALAAEVRLQIDEWLEADPDGLNAGQGQIGRTDNAYFSLTFPFGSVALGRFKHNWSRTTGLMVSDVATPYPRVAFDFTVGRFTVRSVLGELETLENRAQVNQKRFLAAHRVDYQTDHLVISLGESILFATETGLQLRYANPFEVLFATRSDEPRDAIENVGLDGLVWYGRSGVELYGEFFLDDVDVSPGERDAEPFTYAFSLGARLTSVAPWLEVGAEYEQVSAFAYRTPGVVDVWSYLDRGLGENFSDYDRLTFTADLFTPLPGLRLTPALVVQRQGEGDLRQPVPPSDIHLASPALFLGTKETTYRVALQGRYQPNRYGWISWDVGENFVRNAGHTEGNDISDFGARVKLGVIVEFPLARP